DLIGLVDRTIARAPGGHGDKQIPLDYLAQQDPELVIIESNQPSRRLDNGTIGIQPRQATGRRLLASPWLRNNYQLTHSVQASYIWLHVYERRGN
ncbi:MAG: hypothetical protein OXT09_11680, partial [Myxococcales bacterium]|nr:hypothetical protein [Myxococcales bacterium]